MPAAQTAQLHSYWNPQNYIYAVFSSHHWLVTIISTDALFRPISVAGVFDSVHRLDWRIACRIEVRLTDIQYCRRSCRTITANSKPFGISEVHNREENNHFLTLLAFRCFLKQTVLNQYWKGFGMHTYVFGEFWNLKAPIWNIFQWTIISGLLYFYFSF
jgi:hypothetical protein